MVEAVVALGSNLGDREDNLRRAIVEMSRESATKVTQVSSVYETEPMYYENQGWFLNCVVSLETRLGPRELLGRLQAIEARLGRRPGERFGPRVIDIDILLYGSEVISEPGLEIPHPRLAERPFVLVPLDEIRPGLVHPVLRMSVSELVARARSEKRVVRKPGLLTDLQLSLRPRRS